MDILGQSSLLVGITSFALGFSVLARNVRNKLYWTFAVVSSLVSIWALSFFLEKIWGGGVYYRFHLICNVWLAPAALIFIQVMVRIHDRLSRRLLDLSILLAFALTIALLLRLESTIPWLLPLVYFCPGVVVLQILQLMSIDRRLRRGLKRVPKTPTVGVGRRPLIYLGGLLVLSTSVMDHVPWMGVVVPALGNLALAGYLFFISQAISQQRLLNFGAMLSRTLVLVVLALTLTGVYLMLVGWIENSPSLLVLNSFIVSFLVLMLLDPLRSMVGYFTRRLLTQKHLRLEQTLREAQRTLAGIMDSGSLFQAILLTVEQTLMPEWAALFVLRPDATKYRRVRVFGVESEELFAAGSSAPAPPILKELLANHPLLERCQHLRRRGELPILLDQILENEIARSASRVEREQLAGLIQSLKALGSNMLIPLFDSDKILGFATLRVLAPPEPWGGNWGLLGIIYPYFEQAAQTLRNMEVYVRQREKERLAALGEMSAGLAHEIRNPLGAIKGAAQFLDPSSDRPDSRFLKVIIEETDRLNKVVTQFLDYSKPHTAELKPVDLSMLAEKTIETLRPSLAQSIRLEFRPSRESVPVLAAPEQIQQVLVNLLQNSIKALEEKPEGIIRIGIETSGEGDGREAAVIVEDNGRGIKKEHLEKLFIPFFTTFPSGTGLGLSISHKIIEAHRGRIEVLSEEGRFTRFSVILPWRKD